MIRNDGSDLFIRRLRAMTDHDAPRVMLWGFSDPTLAFYLGEDTPRFETAKQLRAVLKDPGDRPLVILVDPPDEADFEYFCKKLRPLVEHRGTWARTLTEPAEIYIRTAHE